MSGTIMSEIKREETNSLVINALKSGPLTRKQIANEVGKSDAAIWLCIRRLVTAHRVKLADGQNVKNGGRSGRAAFWTLDTEPDIKQQVVKSWNCAVRRHPQDVALFGEYRREAA